MNIAYYSLTTLNSPNICIIYKAVDRIIVTSYWRDYLSSGIKFREGYSQHIGQPVKHLYEKEVESKIRKMSLDEVFILFL